MFLQPTLWCHHIADRISFSIYSIHEQHDLASSVHPGQASSLIIIAFQIEISLVGVQWTGVVDMTTGRSIGCWVYFLLLLDEHSTHRCPLHDDKPAEGYPRVCNIIREVITRGEWTLTCTMNNLLSSG